MKNLVNYLTDLQEGAETFEVVQNDAIDCEMVKVWFDVNNLTPTLDLIRRNYDYIVGKLERVNGREKMSVLVTNLKKS